MREAPAGFIELHQLESQDAILVAVGQIQGVRPKHPTGSQVIFVNGDDVDVSEELVLISVALGGRSV